MALKYHPDKNLDNIDAAKEQFLLVQQAYDVLSDPQERAWYDSHREQILRGSHTDYEDESLDVFQYFTAACYKGFNDDETGFYGVYSKVFEQLATEDIEFMDSPDEYEEIPKFGTSTSDYEEVVGPFYAYWQSYCTKKSYSWLCPHNISEIRDRRILREVEKETKKIAQKARKERNDEIRALVSFVRKRDKRVQEYKKKLEEKAEQNRIKQQQHRLAQLRKNQKEAEEMQRTQNTLFNTNDHEEQLRQMEQAYGSDSDYDDYDDEQNENIDLDATENGTNGDLNGAHGEEADAELYVDDLYCVACNKAFKNESSYENHESSKKHRENIEKLKKRMQEEEEGLNENEEEEDEQLSEENEIVDDLLDSETESANHTEKKSNKKSKKSKHKIQMKQQSDDDEDDLEDLEKPLADFSIGNISDNDKEWGDDGNKKGKKSKNKKSTKSVAEQPKETELDTPEVEAGISNKKNSKKSKKSNVKAPITETDESIDTSHTCVTCHSVFDSKNKLFSHLKKTNHGVYIPKGETTTEPKRGKKK